VSDDDHLRGTIDDIAAELRTPIDAGVRRLAAQIQRAADAARDRAVMVAVEVARAEERRQAERAAEERFTAVREAAAAEVEAVRRGAQAQQADLQRQLEEAQAQAQQEKRRWWQAFHALDGARTLSDVLELLPELARHDGARVGVFLVRGDRLSTWRALGFDQLDMVRPQLDLARDAGFAAEAIRSGRAVFWVPGDGPLPSFASVGLARSAGAFPMTVGGAAVALLYADAASTDLARGGGHALLLDVLVRHASRVLEAVTVQRAVGLQPADSEAAVVRSQPGRA
jgi:hypothetical protein